MKGYPTFDDAARRAENLKRYGIWPGILGPRGDGSYALTFDPPDRELAGG